MSPRALIALLTLVLSVAACSDGIKVGPSPDLGPGRDKPTPDNQSIFGPGGLSFGPGANKNANKDLGEGAILGVNAYLWRASLDTVSFMPITSADPFGGTIVTDWYTSPTAPGERYRLNVYILGRDLRSDGVRVNVFRQVQSKKGGWADAPAPNTMSNALEDTILTKARQLRISGLEQDAKQ